jgi:N-acetylmuramoyl-L-alanine amidase
MPGKSSVKGTLTLVMGESTGEMSRNENALYANNKEELLDMSDHKTATIVRAYIQNLQYTYGVYSEMMARFIQNEYSALGMRDHGVRGQPLKVLYSTDMPSVLTEIGFMSNPEDLKYITSEVGQNEIALALFRAIERYIDIVNRSLLVDNQTPSEQTAPEAQKEAVKEEPKKESVEPKKEIPKEEPQKQTETVKRYTIQLMPGKEKIPVRNFDFKDLQDKVWILEAGGDWPYKYCYGDFADYASAKQHLEEAKKFFSQAFIISYDK